MNILNKNKEAFKIGDNVVIIDIISPPVFTCQGKTLTEYDVRNIQLEVAKGNIDFKVANDLEIKDAYECPIIFREDGALVNTPEGYGLASRMMIDILSIKRRNEVKNNNTQKN